MFKNIFISGIGTNVGKTIVSSIFVEALEANYWKPVQTGAEIDSDTETVKKLISNLKSKFYKESYSLKTPVSPHLAAKIEGININLDKILLPKTLNTLIIEGAGGLMVPLNSTQLIIDLIPLFNAKVVIVSNNYLGSINHTLLTINALKQKNIPILGIVFNGEPNLETEKFIVEFTGMKCLLKIAKEPVLEKSTILKYAKILKEKL